ncbi:hypothetical protein Btru_072750 [Bulinus truncatus]|nr:hypothetical protein Btru_072750 [Bulinus truncatus]
MHPPPPMASALCLILHVAVSLLAFNESKEIRGALQFVMSWDGAKDDLTREYWTDDVEDKSHFDVIGDMGSREVVSRSRRDANSDGYVRHGAECYRAQEQLASTAHAGRVRLGRAVHSVVIVEEQEEVRMTCHYCDDDELAGKAQTEDEKDALRKQKLWYKLSRKKTDGKHYKVHEVELDMHDDPTENRVFVTDSHTLVVKVCRVEDAGTYFCRDTSRKDDQFETEMTEEDIHRFIQPESSLKFLYHLDVMKATDVSAMLVTTLDRATLVEMDERRNSSKKMADLPSSAPPTRLPDMNVVVSSVWMNWSPCSVCGKVGTRRRMGECTVNKMDGSKKAHPWYLDVTLRSYVEGVPCESSLFEEHEQLLDAVARPDEVEEEDCEVSCTNYTVQLDDLVPSGHGKERVREELFVEPEGDVVVMKCPKAPVDMPVAWLNGSTVLVGPWLKDATGGRVAIDEHNSLLIHPLQTWDAGHYACIYGGRIRGRLRLEVKPKPPPSKVLRYAYYLLLTYPADLVVFLFLLYVRHRERGKVLNYDLLPLFDDDDDDEDDESGESDEGDENDRESGVDESEADEEETSL